MLFGVKVFHSRGELAEVAVLSTKQSKPLLSVACHSHAPRTGSLFSHPAETSLLCVRQQKLQILFQNIAYYLILQFAQFTPLL